MTTASRESTRSASDRSKAGDKGRLMAIEATLEVRWPAPPPVEGWLADAVSRLVPADGVQRLRVLLGTSHQRLDFEAAGVTIVHTESMGSLFWDAATKCFARLAPEWRPRTTVGASRQVTIDRVATQRQSVPSEGPLDSDIRSTVRIGVDDDVLGQSTIELDFIDDSTLAHFGHGLLRALYCGPACHTESRLPWEELASIGLPVAARMRDAEGRLAGSWSLMERNLVSRPASDFAPPKGYKPMEDRLRKAPRPPAGPTSDDATVPAVMVPPFEIDTSSRRRQELDGVPTRIRDDLSPDCLGSTRLGSMSATLHQDVFTAGQSVANMLAPLVGNTVIGGGTWSIPWMANMTTTVGVSPTAPGAGLFALLRNPRVVNNGVVSGGDGLIDSLAWARLSERDGAGLTRTEREFSAGTLAATLARWGVGAPLDAALLSVSGRVDALSLDDRVTLVEAFESAEFGTLTVALPAAAFSAIPVGSVVIAGRTTPPLLMVTLRTLAGTANFASLPGGILVSRATIGNSGNVILTLNLPDIALTATLLRSPTIFGALLLGLGPVALCLMFPLFCPLFTVLAMLAAFVSTHLSLVRASTTGLSMTLDVSFRFDPNTSRVEPFITVASRTGTTAVSATAVAPNPLAALIDAIAAAIGNAIDGWGTLLAGQVARALEGQMRQQGMHFPVAGRQNELRAVSGLATSSAGGLLELQVDLSPPQGIAVTPWATQVPRPATLTDRLAELHLSMRRQLNPQPATAPGPGPVLTVGSFAGLALSLNAINQYLFSQWLNRRFDVNVTDPQLVSAFRSGAPQLFARPPQRVHLWPATPPRAEIAMDSPAWTRLSERNGTGLTRTEREFAAGTLAATLARWGVGTRLSTRLLAESGRMDALRPDEQAELVEVARGAAQWVVFFDDVRVCFETAAGPMEAGNAPSGTWELAFNFSTLGRVDLAWPFVFAVALESAPPPALDLEPATWEFVDLNNARIMSDVRPSDLEKVASLAARLLLGAHARSIFPPVDSAPAWNAPLLSARQALLTIPAAPPPLRDQAIYVDLLVHRKSAYLLPAMWVSLLELIDGSGAPSLPFLLAQARAPMPHAGSVLSMTAAQGAALRRYLAPRLHLPRGP